MVGAVEDSVGDGSVWEMIRTFARQPLSGGFAAQRRKCPRVLALYAIFGLLVYWSPPVSRLLSAVLRPPHTSPPRAFRRVRLSSNMP